MTAVGYPVKQLRDNLKQLIRTSEEAAAQVLLLPMEIPPNFGKILYRRIQSQLYRGDRELHGDTR